MNELRAKIGVHNQRQSSRVIYIEPWGEDYTLRSGESIEVVVIGKTGLPWFAVVESDEAMRVYVEGDRDVDFTVWQGGALVQCGHNRGQ
jgi:hypothetical protein